ncbi:MAG TPA: EAL domain-containing protein [Candidatus Sulfotelmatobacter sp.]|jgi:diguanylate cyclase (GGDEF)-like protein/PAS domain S-box-containing protein|nr:EAL domain-containing protein [Candidatus Sulfotelmatobacter sp.]
MYANALLQSILDASEIGLVLVDGTGRVVLWNSWISQTSGIAADRAADKTLDEIFGNRLGPRVPLAVRDSLDRGVSSILSTTLNRKLLPLSKPTAQGQEEIKQIIVIKPIDLDGDKGCLLQVNDVTAAESRDYVLRQQARTMQAMAETFRTNEQHVRAIVEHTADAILSFDCAGVISTYNPAAERIFGFSADDAAGRPVGLLIPELSALDTRARKVLAPFIEGRREALGRRQDGSILPIELSISAMIVGPQPHYVAIAHDITERKAAEESLRLQKEWLTTLTDALPDIVCFKDGEGRWLVANQFYLDLFRLNGVDYVGLNAQELGALTPLYQQFMLATLDTDLQAWQEGRPISYEQIIPLPDGSERIFDMRKTPLFNADGSRKGLVVLGRDITERRQNAQRIAHLAHHDTLTGLPNRALFLDRLNSALAMARRNSTEVALLLLNLNKFKEVNDTVGHAIGDKLLRASAKRILHCVRETDTVARLGGDEFAILLAQVSGADGAGTVADSVLRILAEPFGLDGHEVVTSACMGITLFPGDAEDAETLLKNADLALLRSKTERLSRFHFYVAGMDEEVRRRRTTETDLRHALGTEQLSLFYQPQVDSGTGRVLGAEALIRWHHPKNGSIPPALFIPIAERSELIVPLGRWVLHQAAMQIQTWKQLGLPPVKIAVNLSPAQFKHHDLLATVIDVLEQTGVDPRLLQLEITETSAMTNFDYSVGILQNLRALGLTIAIDDFGTGYSSLNYLKRFPVDKLKIDRSFVTDIGLHPDNAAIVKAIINLGRGIGARVNVEGVETHEQLRFMQENGCDEIQGFYFSRPLPADEFAKLLSHPLPWTLEDA